MTYEEAAQIALESAQRDGLTRWVYQALVPKGQAEQWRVTIHYGEIGQALCTRVVPQDRAIPERPQPKVTRR